MSLSDDVRVELRDAAAARRAAAALGGAVSGCKLDASHARSTFSGADLQALAIDSPGDAVAALRRRWPDLWTAICADARGRGERPIPHMVALLEKAMGV